MNEKEIKDDIVNELTKNLDDAEGGNKFSLLTGIVLLTLSAVIFIAIIVYFIPRKTNEMGGEINGPYKAAKIFLWNKTKPIRKTISHVLGKYREPMSMLVSFAVIIFLSWVIKYLKASQ